MSERTPENKAKAISFAAYATLVDLFPSRRLRPPDDGGQGGDRLPPQGRLQQLGGYADTTGYQPVNTPDKVVDRWRWQPLRVPLGDPRGNVQKGPDPAVGHGGPLKAEYWADGPNSEFPPGHWALFAQAMSRKRHDSLDDNVKLFFTLGNAVDDQGRHLPDRAEAGMSRRYGGIHLPGGDMDGRDLGKAVGADAWNKAQTYIRQFPTGPILS